jgi:hypothetical protein
LKIFGIDNHKTLPISYEKDSRQQDVEQNAKTLEKHGSPLSADVRKIGQSKFEQYLNILREDKAQ